MKDSTINKTIGNRFESEFCDILASYGFWSHNIAQNKAGQPADVIASKNNIPVLIDCKVCENDYFTLSRMEDNQITAMTCWKWRGNKYAYFAIKLSSEMIYMIDFDTLCLEMQKGTKRISDFSKYPTLEEWTEDDNIWKSK